MIEKVLVVGDELICNEIKTYFSKLPLKTIIVHSYEDALTKLKNNHDFNVCFCEAVMPDMTALAFLDCAKTEVPDMLVVPILPGNDERMIEKALTNGAFDVLAKPLTLGLAKAVIVKAEKWLQKARQNEYMRSVMRYSKTLLADGYEDRFLGNSYQTTRIKELCGRVADSNKPVLITGERGTGKKIVADEICDLNDPKSCMTRVAIDCSMAPSERLEGLLFGIHASGSQQRKEIGLLEVAKSSFLLIENVMEMPMAVQGKLAAFLRTGRFNRVGGGPEINVQVRVLATSRTPLKSTAARKGLNADLLRLLKPLTIAVPSLRDRPGDITVIAKKMLKRLNFCHGRDLTFSAQALERMALYQWPGNLAELERFVKRLILIAKGPVVTAEDLTNEILGATPVTPAIDNVDVNRMFNIRDIERLTIIRALKETKGNRCKAADLLGFTSRTLRNKLIEYNEAGLWDDDFDPKTKPISER